METVNSHCEAHSEEEDELFRQLLDGDNSDSGRGIGWAADTP